MERFKLEMLMLGAKIPPTPNILHVPMEEIDKIGKLDPIKISHHLTILLREHNRI